MHTYTYDPRDQLDSRIDLQRAVARLDAIDRTILEMTVAGYTQAEIGERVGMTHQAVALRLASVQGKLVCWLT